MAFLFATTVDALVSPPEGARPRRSYVGDDGATPAAAFPSLLEVAEVGGFA